MTWKEKNRIFIDSIRNMWMRCTELPFWLMILYITLFYITNGLILAVLTIVWCFKEIYKTFKEIRVMCKQIKELNKELEELNAEIAEIERFEKLWEKDEEVEENGESI